jgi:predicted RNA binding protein YcfA (HicA-like mRNA interferase family)
VLEKCGFELERIKGSHHFYHNPETKKSASVPFHSNDVPKALLNEILKEAGISREEFLTIFESYDHCGIADVSYPYHPFRHAIIRIPDADAVEVYYSKHLFALANGRQSSRPRGEECLWWWGAIRISPTPWD